MFYNHSPIRIQTSQPYREYTSVLYIEFCPYYMSNLAALTKLIPMDLFFSLGFY